MITAEQFAALTPQQRGYAVYMLGERADEPYIPNESNPYPPGSSEAAEWDEGQQFAVLDVQDSDDS